MENENSGIKKRQDEEMAKLQAKHQNEMAGTQPTPSNGFITHRHYYSYSNSPIKSRLLTVSFIIFCAVFRPNPLFGYGYQVQYRWFRDQPHRDQQSLRENIYDDACVNLKRQTHINLRKSQMQPSLQELIRGALLRTCRRH